MPRAPARDKASGWKARRGTALAQDDGDADFVRRAALALAETGQCEIVSLHAGDTPVAAAIVLRHQDRAFYFKLGVDERFAKFSPGVQLTLELTRHLCADPSIAMADSTADADHPMINPIWRGRLTIGDMLIPLRPRDPVVPLIAAAIELRRLVREPRHLMGTLRMMSNWNLSAFERDLPRLTTPLVLVVAQNDRTVPPQQAATVQRRVANASMVVLPGLGHLAHEEAPAMIAAEIVKICCSRANPA